MGDPPSPPAHPHRRHRPARRRGRDPGQHPRVRSCHDRRDDTGRVGRGVPAGAGRQRRRRCGGCALVQGALGHVERRRVLCCRDRFRCAGPRLEIHRDEHRLHRDRGGAGRGRWRRPGCRCCGRRGREPPQPRVHRRAPAGQPAPERTDRRCRRLAGHQAFAEAAAAHRRRQTWSWRNGFARPTKRSRR